MTTNRALRAGVKALIFAVAAATVAPAAQAATLNTGRWEIIANGFPATLTIRSIDFQGNLLGSWRDASSTNDIKGFWDENGRRIIFQRIINSSDPSTIQVYTGYLFNQGSGFCQGRAPQQTMAGYFEAFVGTGATAVRPLYGWAARQCRERPDEK